MNREKDKLERRVKELEATLDEERSISAAAKKLFQNNIKELDDVYIILKEKLKALRLRDERIKGFEAELFRSNKLSSLGELASSVAHEIKNPLISIQGFAKRIEKTKDIEKIWRYARLIDEESGRLSLVLTRLLNFSRMDEPHKEIADLQEIVDDTALFMRHHLTRFKNVNLVVEKSKDRFPVLVDRIHIQQVLVNIINNAAQAMPNGGTIRIETGIHEGKCFAEVSDEGEGIDEINLQKIFEPFFTTKPRGVGTGLGLSLSKRLMEANEGGIEIQTRKGSGTTFKLVMPLASHV